MQPHTHGSVDGVEREREDENKQKFDASLKKRKRAILFG